MRKSITRFILLVFSSLVLISCAKDSVDEEINSIDHIAKTSVNYTYTDIEKEILSAINDYRKEQDLKELSPLGEISLEAEDHNYYMVETGKVSHDNFGERYTTLVNSIAARAVSENVAYGYHTADAVVKAWIKSDGHRENIESNFTHFGVSVVKDKEGRNYFTNIFVRR
ncbi:MAG: CAP domain-containing protein [Salegentibacter sp.]|uniref:CAP domain-containing protein n=1 Tax=Salegentibacter sp. TaxID=1903072 RepID=UPI0028703249|nr:CAP domain-containing protein [Salegentibacter sp.]MDR9457664.1 CAP domain-containing protein [Salegentibacter sp.]